MTESVNDLAIRLVEARKIIRRLERENTEISQLAGFYLSENDSLRKQLEESEESAEERRELEKEKEEQRQRQLADYAEENEMDSQRLSQVLL